MEPRCPWLHRTSCFTGVHMRRAMPAVELGAGRRPGGGAGGGGALRGGAGGRDGPLPGALHDQGLRPDPVPGRRECAPLQPSPAAAQSPAAVLLTDHSLRVAACTPFTRVDEGFVEQLEPLRSALTLSLGRHTADAVARRPAELWTDQLQECDSDDDAESIEVAEQKCVPAARVLRSCAPAGSAPCADHAL